MFQTLEVNYDFMQTLEVNYEIMQTFQLRIPEAQKHEPHGR